jgi:uncharacterized protein YggE
MINHTHFFRKRQTMKELFISTLFVLQAIPAFAAIQSDSNGITATGNCLKKITQDRASVTLTASSLAPDARQASTESTKLHQKLREALQGLKLQNAVLETSNYSVGEEREWINKKMVSKGFRARISLQFETSEIARIGDVIATATKLGIKDIDGLNTFVSSEKYKAEYESCLEIASRNAKDKAIKLARGAGIKLGIVKSISEGAQSSAHTFGSKPMMMTRSFAEADSNDDSVTKGGPTIDTKSVDLNVSATVTFGTE